MKMDFDACRFDFRLDAKNGLTPSRRKKAERRSNCYNTLFKCKVCGSLFDQRAALLAHKLVHNEFKCPICELKVSRKATLKEHMQVVHGIGKVTSQDMGLMTEEEHRASMKEQMSVVRGVVPRKRGSGPSRSAKKLKDMPSSNPALMQQQPPPPGIVPSSSPPAPPPGSGPGCVYINVPVFIPNGNKAETAPSSPEAMIKSAVAAAMGMELNANNPIQLQHPLTNQALMTVPGALQPTPVSAPSTPVSMPLMQPNASTPNPTHMTLPVTIAPPAKRESEDLEPGEIRSAFGNQKRIKYEQPPQPEAPPMPTLVPNPNIHSIAMKCEDGSVRYFNFPAQALGAQVGPAQGLATPVQQDDQIRYALQPMPMAVAPESDEAQDLTTTFRPNISSPYTVSESDPAAYVVEDDGVIDLSVKRPSSGDTDGGKGKKKGLDTIMAKLWQTKIRSHSGTPENQRMDDDLGQEYENVITIAPQSASASPMPAQMDSDIASMTMGQPIAEAAEEFRPVIVGGSSKRKLGADMFTATYYTCSWCKLLFDSEDKMWEHAKAHQEEDNSAVTDCKYCGVTCAHREALQIHIAESHAEEDQQVFTCEYDGCGEQFPSDKDRWHHIERVHTQKWEQKRIVCPHEGCGRKFVHMNHLKRHMVAHSEDRPIMCAVEGCGKKFKEMKTLARHQVKHGGVALMSQCLMCNFITDLPHLLSLHMKEKHSEQGHEFDSHSGSPSVASSNPPTPITIGDEEMPSDVEAESKGPTDLVPDDVNQDDNMDFTPEGVPVLHAAAVPGVPSCYTSVMRVKVNTPETNTGHDSPPTEATYHVCQVCKQLFDSAARMWSHRMVEHEDITRVNCDQCNYHTESRSQMEVHALTAHNKELSDAKEYTCNWCGKVFTSRHGYKYHIERHSLEGPPRYLCPMSGCENTFQSKLAIKIHLKHAHPKRPMSNPANPVNNQPKKRGRSREKSPELNDDFSLPKGVMAEDRSLMCDYPGCDKAFREAKHLKVHKMLHTDERPLKCNICEYSCRQRNSLNWHMKSKHGMQKNVTPDGKTVYL